MPSARMEALTDGVVAIVITVMVIELGVPGDGWAGVAACMPLLLVYALSFVNVGLFWNNHHHLLQATGRIDGLFVLFGLFGGMLGVGLLLPRFQGFFESSARGAWTLPELFGVSYGVVVAIVVALALLAFFVAERIERRAS